MSVFKGAGVAIITPFINENEVNYEELKRICIEQADRKTDAIIVCGTTGESATLSPEEHRKCIKTAVEAVEARIPVIAGCGANNTKKAVSNAIAAKEEGADALLCVTPYYNKATQKGLKEYFKEVAGATDLPLIMYNVPSRTGCNILPETAVELAKEVDNIVAIKDASGDISQTAAMAAINDGSLDIYSGNDDQIIPILSLGGIGVISVLSNVAPEDTHDMVMKFLDGDTKGAMELQLKAIDLIKSLFCEVNPIPVKTAMNLLGYNAGVLRSPMCDMEDKNLERLKTSMINYGLTLK